MVSVSGTPAADQARLLGNRFDVVPIANPTRRWQRQYAFIDNRNSLPLFASTSMRGWGFRFLCKGSTCSVGCNARQPRLESQLHALSIACSQTIFGANSAM